jgi:hypothetical protein
MFHFSGALELISHLLNMFGRREWCQAPNSPYLAAIYESISQAGTLNKISKVDFINVDSFRLLMLVLSGLPVKTCPDGLFSKELAEVLK